MECIAWQMHHWIANVVCKFVILRVQVDGDLFRSLNIIREYLVYIYFSHSVHSSRFHAFHSFFARFIPVSAAVWRNKNENKYSRSSVSRVSNYAGKLIMIHRAILLLHYYTLLYTTEYILARF